MFHCWMNKTLAKTLCEWYKAFAPDREPMGSVKNFMKNYER